MIESINNGTKEENILFLYLPTGSGHYSFCKSIDDQIKSYNLDNVKTYISYPLEKKYKFTVFIIEKFYKISSIDIPIIWTIGYNLSRLRPFMRVYNKISTKKLFNVVKQEVEEKNITKIVSSHFLYNECLYKITKALDKEIKVLTLVTDPFTVPSVWAYKQRFPCIVNSDLARKRLRRKFRLYTKRPYPSIHIFNPPIQPKFNCVDKDIIVDFIKQEGINKNYLTVSFLGGAEGIPKLKRFLKRINKTNEKINLIIVTGRNQKQYSQVENFKKKSKNINYFTYHFINYMEKIVSVSDLVICKAGTSSVFENLITGKTMIIYKYIHGQEKGTKDYIVKNNLGFYIKNTKQLVEKIEELSRDRNLLHEFEANLKKENIKSGTKEITDFILKY